MADTYGIVLTSRISEETENKMNYILQRKNEINKALGFADVKYAKRELIAEAVDLLYATLMDENTGDAYLNRMSSVMERNLSLALSPIIDNLNALSYKVQKVVEYENINLQTYNFGPDLNDDVLRDMVEGTNKFEAFVDDKLMRKVGK